jgi:choline-sulfatase
MRILLLAGLLGMTLSCGSAPAPSKPQKPNILFIAIDDQNDWIGALGGHPQAQAPNIDALARRGTLFTNAHAQSPLCNPSRTSLMTSLRPSTTGIYGLAPWYRDLDEWKDAVSLPRFLAQNGYRTYSTGKIYHGGYGREEADEEKGDWQVASWAVERLNEGPEEPFFLSAGFFLPHAPSQVA